MRSKEFIKEAGRNGSMDDFGQPINNTPALPPQQLRDRYGNKIASGTPGVYWNEPADATAYAGFSPGQSVGPGAADVTLPQTQRVRADRTAEIQAQADAEAAAAAAAAARNHKAITTTERPAPPAAVVPAPVKPAPPAAVVPAPVKPAPPAAVVPAPAPAVKPAPVQTDTRVYGPTGEIILPNAMAAPGKPPVSDLDVYKTSELDRYGGETTRKKNDSAPAQNTTPPPDKFNMSPTVWSYAINMGLIQNGKPVESAIRAFQKKNGLEVDGVIGNDTSNAIISAATTGMPNIGRGNQGGATPNQKTLPQLPTVRTGEPPAGSGTVIPGVKDSKGRQVYKRPDSSVMAWDPTTQLFSFYSGNLPSNNATPAAAGTGGPPAGSGTIMPGVKDSKGRQVYKRPDSSVMAWDPTTQRFFPYSGQSMIDRFRTSVGIPAGGTSPGIKESQEIQRMKFLAGLNK